MRLVTFFAFLIACGCSGSDGATTQNLAIAPTGRFESDASGQAFNGAHLVAVPVLEVRHRLTRAIAIVTTGSAEVVTTPEHPFAVATGGWKPAARLTRNDQVVTAQGTPAPVLGVRLSKVPVTSVYNLGVARTHSYFVGRQSLLVHNTCGLKPILLSEFQSSRTRELNQARRTADYLKLHPNFRNLDTYTAGINLNGSLRKRATGEPLNAYDISKLKDADGLTQLLKDAARDGHSFEGVVSRGVKHGIRGRVPDEAWQRYLDLKPGDVWTTDTFLSMTADPDVAKKFGTELTMRIRQWSGIPIADISNSVHEREVLLPPGTRFRVIDRQYEDGKLTIDMEEVLSDEAEAGSSGSKPHEAPPSPENERPDQREPPKEAKPESSVPKPPEAAPSSKPPEAAPSPDRQKQGQITEPEAQLQARLETARKELESIKHGAGGSAFQQAINADRAATLKKQIAGFERQLAELHLQGRLETAREELESIKHGASGSAFQQAINAERAATLKKEIVDFERKLAELRVQH
jgi:hypothetical protein